VKFKEWFDDHPKIEVLPWERKGKGRLGNELQDTATGGKILGSPFRQGKNTSTQLPTSTPKSPSGLGELGMKEVGKSTFKPNPIPAGESPTISRGFPV
jgi:hypothetical protein